MTDATTWLYPVSYCHKCVGNTEHVVDSRGNKTCSQCIPGRGPDPARAEKAPPEALVLVAGAGPIPADTAPPAALVVEQVRQLESASGVVAKPNGDATPPQIAQLPGTGTIDWLNARLLAVTDESANVRATLAEVQDHRDDLQHRLLILWAVIEGDDKRAIELLREKMKGE